MTPTNGANLRQTIGRRSTTNAANITKKAKGHSIYGIEKRAAHVSW